MKCPDVDVLQARGWSPDVSSHVGACGSCKLVMELIDERSQAAESRERRVECAKFEALIAVRVGAELEGAAYTMLEAHLRECADCRALAATMAPSDDAPDHLALPAIDTSAYALGAEVARGGMGRIIAARDLRIGRPVAVKELLAKNVGLATRFEREARVTARLQHPGIVPIYEIGRWESGMPFYAMRMVDGKTLRSALLACKTLPERLALLPSVIAAAEAVAFAHAHQVIHRDLTPSNILVGEYGETVVIDWGLAKDLSETTDDADVGPYRRDPSASADLTAAGAVIGTASYMPPEQAAGDRVDARADVYALGAILYHLLAGNAPYKGTLDDVLRSVKSEPPRPLPLNTPRDLASIVSKAMARDPEDRYPSAKELAAELTTFQAGRLVDAHEYTRGELFHRWIRKRRGTLVVAAIAVAVLAGFGALAIARIVDERDRAEDRESEALVARENAETQRKKSEALTVRLLAEQGRQELIAGNTARALAWFNEANKAGDTSPELQVMLGATLRQIESIERTLGCDSNVQSLELSPDQTRLLAACGHGVKVWRISDGALVTHIEAGVDGALFSPDGRQIASWRYNHFTLWDSETGAEMFSRTEHANRIRSVLFAAGDRLVTIADDSTARVWDAKGNTLHVLAAGSKTLNVVRGMLTSAGRTLITYTGDGRIQLWDVVTGKATRSLAQTQFMSSDVTPDGARLVTCAIDGSVRIWDLATSRATATFVAHAGPIRACAFSRDGRRLLTAAADKTAKVWDVANGGLITSVVHDGLIATAGFSPDATRLITLGADSFTVWDATSGSLIASMDGMKDDLFRFSADGRRMVTVRHPNTLVVWKDLSNGAKPIAVPDGSKVIKASPQTTQLAIRTAEDTVSIVDADSLRALPHEPVREPVVWSRDGSRLGAMAPSGGVVIIDMGTGATVARILTTTKPTALELDEHGRRLLVRGAVGEVWDVDRGRMVLGFEPGVRVEGLSRSGTKVVAARDPKQVEIWNIERRLVQSRFNLERKLIEVLGFDRDEQHVVLTELEGDTGWPVTLLRIHETATGATKLSVGGRLVSWLDASGKLITTTGIGDKLEVFDASSGARLNLIANPYQLLGATVTPDRALLLGVTSSGEFQLRSTTDGRLLAAVGMKLGFAFTQDSWNTTGIGGDESADVSSFVSYGANPILWRFPREHRAPTEIDKIIRERVDWRVVDGRLVVANAAVRGRVTRRGREVVDADVSIAFEDVDYRNHARSGADGTFEFSELRTATYHVMASSQSGDARGRRSIFVKGDDVVVDIELDREASITGRTVNEHGQPVAGVPVRALCCHDADGGNATSDANGRFTIVGLGAGAYLVHVVSAQDGRKTGFVSAAPRGVPVDLSNAKATVGDVSVVVNQVETKK